MNRKLIRSVLAISGVSLLAGCSATRMEPYEREASAVAANSQAAMNALQTGQKVQAAPRASVQHLDNEVYIPVRKVAVTKKSPSDSNPALTRHITVNRTFISAQEMAERITALSGIPVSVAPDVAVINQAQSGVAGLPAIAGAAGVMPTPLPQLPSVAGQNNATGLYGAQQPGAFPVSLSYTGTLAGLLDVVCTRIGIAWEMDNGQLRLYRYQSKTFRLSAMPGDTSMDAKVGTSSSSGSGSSSGSNGSTGSASTSTQSSSSTQNSGVNFSGLSVWKGIEDAIKAMLTPAGKIVASPSLGTVTVTDTPIVVAQVEKFIEQQNKALSRQVIVNFRVLSVELTDTNSYGINWDVVYTSLSKSLGLTFNTAATAIANASSLGMSVLGAADGAKTTNWTGTSAIVEALATQGKVSTVTSASVTTLNNQPAPIQVGRSTSYVANSTTSISTGVSSTSMSTGTVNSGFAMSVLPHIMDGRKLLLQYAIDMSSLLSLNTITAGTSVIQTPDVDTRNSLQRVLVNSGDTIVVAGFENKEVSSKTQGLVDAKSPELGGSINGKNNKTVIVILIQPVVVE
ncbi:MAG: PilN family type IVB pilus formation outer membrane protein [Propionivibrio sp.]